MSDFEEVHEEEQKHINKARECYSKLCEHLPGDKEGKLGLALSGGGVRSATFNLGVIQALAEFKLLKCFDYLSTVSGGGYIGSWLSAWCHRHPEGVCGVEQTLAEKAKTPTFTTDRHEPPAVSWLRQHSNYLTPRTGLFSLDTWTGIAFYLRNLVLNQTLFIAMLAALLLLPHVLVNFFPEAVWSAFAWVAIGVALLLLSYVFTGCNFHYLESLSGETIFSPSPSPWPKSVVRFLSGHLVALLTLLAGLCVITGWLQLIQLWPTANVEDYWVANRLKEALQWLSTTAANPPIETVKKAVQWLSEHSGWQVLFFMVGGAVLYFVLWILALLARSVSQRVTEGGVEVIKESMTEPAVPKRILPVHWESSVIWSLVTGAVGGLMLYGFHNGLLILKDHFFVECLLPTFMESLLPRYLVVGPGVGIIVTLFLLAVILHMGLVGRGFSTDIHEWWSRVGASMLLFTLGWVTLVIVAIFAPPTVAWLWYNRSSWIVSGVGTWMFSTLSGVLLGKSSLTSGKDANPWLERIVHITPYLFIAGLLISLACGLQALLEVFSESSNCNGSGFVDFVKCTFDPKLKSDYKLESWWSELILGGCIMVVLLLSWRLEVNLFSYHIFYRNRLARCYLGASRQPHDKGHSNPQASQPAKVDSDAKDDNGRNDDHRHNTASVHNQPRRPHPFTHFDPQDTPQLGAMEYNCKNKALPQRPFHIINATLNLTAPRNLAWQERKATSFVFTPIYCGYQEPGETNGCYQKTKEYVQGINYLTLATALTVSGAAACPNQGYHTKPALAFLLTLFNVRLGWWIANPKDRYYWKQKGSARWSLLYLLHELFGHASKDSALVYLSDGGHFENLGIYELVRRRCEYIVAIDASCDPQFQFDDLSNAIRKIRTDFGIEIDIETSALIPNPSTHLSHYHCAVGTIHYEQIYPNASPGWLLYIKPSLTNDEPTDIGHYAATNLPFPHQSTKDQWFNESQFESYRRLGQHITREVFQAVSTDRMASSLSDLPLPELFRKLKERWYPPSTQVAITASQHERALDALYERLRVDSNLQFLDGQFYPEWSRLMKDSQCVIAVSKGLWLPPTYQERRTGFYFCHDLIRFMQNVYLDLNLEEEHMHPDNRGWLNLFRQWSWSSMFRVSWTICASSCSARFQHFCEYHLGLGFGISKFDWIEVNPLLKYKFGENSEEWLEHLIYKGCRGEFNPIELNLITHIFLDLLNHNKLAEINIYSLQLVVVSRFPHPDEAQNEVDSQERPGYLRLTFGFAITYLEKTESTSGHDHRLSHSNRQERQLAKVDSDAREGTGRNDDQDRKSEVNREVIRYFRIQDHLRNMGLGYKALRKLRELRVDNYDISAIPDIKDDPKAFENMKEFKIMFDSLDLFPNKQ